MPVVADSLGAQIVLAVTVMASFILFILCVAMRRQRRRFCAAHGVPPEVAWLLVWFAPFGRRYMREIAAAHSCSIAYLEVTESPAQESDWCTVTLPQDALDKLRGMKSGSVGSYSQQLRPVTAAAQHSGLSASSVMQARVKIAYVAEDFTAKYATIFDV